MWAISIQIVLLKGKIVAKVFGKVDMFMTYRSIISKLRCPSTLYHLFLPLLHFSSTHANKNDDTTCVTPSLPMPPLFPRRKKHSPLLTLILLCSECKPATKIAKKINEF